jgi:hypothetical protein
MDLATNTSLSPIRRGFALSLLRHFFSLRDLLSPFSNPFAPIPTMGKQLVNVITCGCESSAPFFVIYKPGANPRRIGDRLVLVASFRNLENVALVTAASRKQHAVFGKVIIYPCYCIVFP